MWKATLDVNDDNAKGGHRREILVKGVTREAADDTAMRAAEAHAAAEGHSLLPTQSYPGATFIYCECRACYHVAGRG